MTTNSLFSNINVNTLNSEDIVILVTGGCGFVGTELVKTLAIDKYTIYVLDDFSSTVSNHPVKQYFDKSSNKTFHYSDPNQPNINYIKGSTIDIQKNCSHFTPHLVFHFGEFSRINASWDDVNTVMSSNLLGTSNVLDYCIKNKAKLVYSASSAILGESLPTTPYTYTKKCMVELVKCYHKWYNLDYIITYFYNVYGPNQITEGKYATVMGIFERQYLNNENLSIVLPGTQERTFTYIDDIIDGIITSIYQFKNEEIPIASNDTISIKELAKLFVKGDESKINYLPEQRGNRLKSVKQLQDKLREIGWNTTHNLFEYIKSFQMKDHSH